VSAAALAFWVSLGGGLVTAPAGWSSTSTWELYAETARLEATYEGGAGPALEAALGLRFARRLGIAAALTWSRREETASVEALLPHPFYLDRARSVAGTAEGLEHREAAAHLDLEVRPVTGRVELALFAGVSLVRVEADLVESVEATEEYPYDEAAFRSATSVSRRSDPTLGWNAGAAVAWAVASRLHVGVEARWVRAGAELEQPGGGTARLDAGGLHGALFVRLRF